MTRTEQVTAGAVAPAVSIEDDTKAAATAEAQTRPSGAPRTKMLGAPARTKERPAKRSTGTTLADDKRRLDMIRAKATVRRARARITTPAGYTGRKAQAVEAFRHANDRAHAEQQKGRQDPLSNDELRRINETLNNLSTENRVLKRRVKARGQRPPLGGARGGGLKGLQALHRKGVLNYLRTGQEYVDGRHLKDLERDIQSKAMATDTNPDGGYSVLPERDSGPMERILLELSPMRSVANVRSINAYAFTKPFNMGGATAVWTGEREPTPETDTPTITEMEFPTFELNAKPKVTQRILEDSSMDIEAFIADEVGNAFAEKESVAWWDGSGTDQPRGIYSYPFEAGAWSWGKFRLKITGVDGGFLATDAGTGVGPADILIDVMHSLKKAHRMTANWFMTTLTLAEVRKLKDADGNMLWRPGLTEGEPDTLLGKAINEDEYMAEIPEADYASSKPAILFGDMMKTYTVIDRVGVSVLRDPYTNDPFILFKTRKRVGGGAENFEAMTGLRFAA